jgi:hypothetical protein
MKNATLTHLTRSLASRHVARRVSRAIPVLGLALVAYSVVHRMRAKGLRRGGLDALLDLTPVVGQIKAAYELFASDIIKPARAH